MLLTVLRLTVVFALLVVVPGVLLVNALLPPARARLSRAERAYLSVGAGILLLMFVGVVLGLLPYESRGLFSTLATGLPVVELAMMGLSGLFLWVGLQRGAYPRLQAARDAAAPRPLARREPQTR